MRNYPILTLTEKGADFLRGGHVWVFADEVTHITGTPEDGALADVCSPKGKYLGTGFYNSNSKIRVRIISKNANDRLTPPSGDASSVGQSTTAARSWASAILPAAA